MWWGKLKFQLLDELFLFFLFVGGLNHIENDKDKMSNPELRRARFDILFKEYEVTVWAQQKKHQTLSMSNIPSSIISSWKQLSFFMYIHIWCCYLKLYQKFTIDLKGQLLLQDMGDRHGYSYTPTTYQVEGWVKKTT